MESEALQKITGDVGLNDIYDKLLVELGALGPHHVEAKKTSLHVVHKRAFLGIHPRKNGLLINIVASEPIDSKRIVKAEKVSTNRYHNEALLGTANDIDTEFVAWMRTAYDLTFK